MNPTYQPPEHLHPPMSRLSLRSPYSPDPSPPSSWQPTTPLSYPTSSSPNLHHPRPSNDTYPTRLSPSSESSLTDRDISRRNLAASGLDVSAPEFVPSFAMPLAHSPQPIHHHNPPTHPVQPQYDPVQTPSPGPYEPSLPSPPLFQHSSPRPSPFYNPPSHSHLLPNLNTLYRDDPSYNPNPPPNPIPPENPPNYLSQSPPLLSNHRPAHLDEATYVTAVQHFDEEFPALANTRTESTSTPTPRNPHWNSHNPPSRSPNRKHTSAGDMAAMFPKALGWDALQRERQQKAREQRASREWQAAYDQFANDLDPEEGLEEVEETRVSNDVGSVWVSTGQSVGELYQQLRAEAAEEARLRNKYFDRAAAAFKRNDGATAKRFGALGREANERMKKLHRQAADAIFEARNPVSVKDVVDLHGLHVSEALERLPGALERAGTGEVRILTGTGHHTKGTGRARLRPAVKKWLQERGYFFEEVMDANEYVGSFRVEMGR